MQGDGTRASCRGENQTMRLKSISLLAAVATVVLATGSFAGQAQPAAPAPAAPTKFVPPVRGEAEVGMTKPVTKRLKDEVVTTFQVKNMSTTNSIAGLKVSEFWYDAKGQTVMPGVVESHVHIFGDAKIAAEMAHTRGAVHLEEAPPHGTHGEVVD